ncbi:MAG: radical SAM protein [Clostridiales bacterium]|nr:radical SAM protein [Clostridiales bacterium]
MKIIDNPLRIKVTGRCNRACAYCHHEGGDADIEELAPDGLLREYIVELFRKLHMNAAAITGGEPLIYEGLPQFIQFLHEETDVEKIYLTTNGTIRKEEAYWGNLISNGLKKVNISIPDIFVEYVQGMRISDQFLQNQIGNIRTLNLLGMEPDVNVVVFSDLAYTKYVLETLRSVQRKGSRFHIYLLPNLNDRDNERSRSTIYDVCREMGFHEVLRPVDFEGISNSSLQMGNDDGEILFVKSTRKNNQVYMFPPVCENCECREKCREGFYGLRLEKRNGIYFIRLCLIKNTDDVLIPFRRFLDSDFLLELEKVWRPK